MAGGPVSPGTLSWSLVDDTPGDVGGLGGGGGGGGIIALSSVSTGRLGSRLVEGDGRGMSEAEDGSTLTNPLDEGLASSGATPTRLTVWEWGLRAVAWLAK